MTPLRVTVLSDNTAMTRSTRGEHGLAYHLQTPSRNILFDTGQGLVLADNAQALNIPLSNIDTIAFSHGHYDHTGGLPHVMAASRRPVAIHLHPHALSPRYNKTRHIGIPPAARGALNHPNARLSPNTGPATIAPGIRLTGCIPRPHPEDLPSETYHLDPNQQNPDPIDDDQALFFDAPQGLVILLGCAHAGLIHTIRHIRQLAPNRPLHALIGGMHLGNAGTTRLEWVIRQLREIAPNILVPLHCTGARAVAALWNAFPNACQPAGTGTTFNFEIINPTGDTP